VLTFPRWMYHAEHEARIFPHQAELDASGAGWVCTPSDLIAPEVKPEPEPVKVKGKPGPKPKTRG
jgi:hypothetical protein